MTGPSVLDVDLRNSLHMVVRLRCKRCGFWTDRRARYLVEKYGVVTLRDVANRARCLEKKGTCRGDAEVTLHASRAPDEGGPGNWAVTSGFHLT